MALRLLLFDIDPVDAGEPRALGSELEHRLDRVGLPLEHRFDGAVGKVADPAGNAARGRAAARLLAEEDALNVAMDDRAPADASTMPKEVESNPGQEG